MESQTNKKHCQLQCVKKTFMVKNAMAEEKEINNNPIQSKNYFNTV